MKVEVIVIGAGLIGAAAARYLSQNATSVVIIGPAEPVDYESHAGVFASHYDSGRLTHRLSKNLTWGHLCHQALQRYRPLEAQSGKHFYEPCGGLTVAPNLTELGQARDWPAIIEAFEMPVTYYPDAHTISATHPMFAFPATMQGYLEPNPAGIIDPRKMVAAQLTVAAQQGVTIVRDTAVEVRARSGQVTIKTRTGKTFTAGRVLIAAGAFSNCFELLPRRLALRVKSETTVLARISEAEGQRLARMPFLIYDIESPVLDGIYLLPPIRYPDGRLYLKLGWAVIPSPTKPCPIWRRCSSG